MPEENSGGEESAFGERTSRHGHRTLGYLLLPGAVGELQSHWDRPQGLLRQAQSWGRGPGTLGSDTHSGCSEWWARDGGSEGGLMRASPCRGLGGHG